MVVNKEGAHNVGNDYSRYVSTTIFLISWNFTCRILFHNVMYVLSFTVVYYLYILMVVIIIYFICSNQSGKYQVKDMNVYIDPLINRLLNIWNGITMYDVSRPIQ